MIDRIPLDAMTSDQLDALYEQLDKAEQETTATAAAHLTSLVLDRAERAEARLSHLQATSEAAGILLTRTTDERDRLATTLREVLAVFSATACDQPGGRVLGYLAESPIHPDDMDRWRAVLDQPKEQPDA